MKTLAKDLTPKDALRRLALLGVTAQEWCSRAEVSVSTWQRWQRGDHSPRQSTRTMLSMALTELERERGGRRA